MSIDRSSSGARPRVHNEIPAITNVLQLINYQPNQHFNANQTLISSKFSQPQTEWSVVGEDIILPLRTCWMCPIICDKRSPSLGLSLCASVSVDHSVVLDGRGQQIVTMTKGIIASYRVGEYIAREWSVGRPSRVHPNWCSSWRTVFANDYCNDLFAVRALIMLLLCEVQEQDDTGRTTQRVIITVWPHKHCQ